MKIKTSFITTVFNEQDSINEFLESIFSQSVLPDEIIIVDGGSTDNTLSAISAFKFPQRKNNPNIKILFKKGNRSVGRNEAIKNAKGDIILCSDSGNTLENKWIENILKPFKDKKTDVVAGYYKGIPANVFQKCLIPYVLVMKDKVDKNNFLPATRSVAFRKSIWKKAGGFDEKLSHNEDYVFANKLIRIGAKIVFEEDAIVNWRPRKNLKDAFVMFFRFAFGDAEAGILRTKVLFLYLRYFLLFYFIFLDFFYKSVFLTLVILLSPIFYVFWSIYKNANYVKESQKIIYFPLIQISADLAVLSGTFLGLIKKILNYDYLNFIKNNKGFVFLILIYSLTILSQITWGLPNNNHPFPYHMDEWHQLQSVRFEFKYGTPNLTGAANGTVFHFFYSGLYLIPFMLFKIVDPFSIKSAIDNIPAQNSLFIILRLETLFFGILTAFYIYKTVKLLKANSLTSVFLFIFTPLWLMLSNYFKYDIALSFWMVLSLYSFLKYFKNPTTFNFVLAGIFSALSLSVKVSGIAIFPVYVLAFLLFTPKFFKYTRRFVLGILTYLITLVAFGIPDIAFGGRNMNEYLTANLVNTPSSISNLSLPYSNLLYIFFHHFPFIFGHSSYIVFVFSVLIFCLFLFKKLFKGKLDERARIDLFILLSFLVMLSSLIPLKIFIEGNRALVLLPYFVLISVLTLKYMEELLKGNIRKILILIFLVFASFQLFESYAWVMLKQAIPPQEASSNWILKNIPLNSQIGIESIPLYQEIPDVVLKEFYDKQYNPNSLTKYNYLLVNKDTKTLPDTVIITDTKVSIPYDKKSPKKDLIEALNNKKYKLVQQFTPDFKLFYIFDDAFVYRHSGLIGYPADISIFEKKYYNNNLNDGK